jgi:hypothetical protein
MVKTKIERGGRVYKDGYCSNTTGESRMHSIRGAQVLSDSDGGVPNDGIYWCTSQDNASGKSELEAQLVLVDRVEGEEGDCPDDNTFKLKVPVDLYAGIRAKANVRTPAIFHPLTSLLPGISFKETSFIDVTSDGTNLTQHQGKANVTLASDCTTTYSMSGTVSLKDAGASVGVSKTCAGGAINANKSLLAKAVSIGDTDLYWNGSGSTDASLTVLAAYRTHADSVGCADGSGIFGCKLLSGSARANTDRYCLEVEPDGYCEVVPTNGAALPPGLSCDVDVASVSLGTCD